MSSSYLESVRYLDMLLEALNKGVAGLRSMQINSEEYRIRYDNYELTLGLAIYNLLLSIRKNCIGETGVLPLAHFCTRTLQELCVRTAAVNFLEEELNDSQQRVLREVRVLQIISSQKNKVDMLRLLEDEKDKIGKSTFVELQGAISNYKAVDHYKKRGFQHRLVDKAANKQNSIFSDIKASVYGHATFRNFMSEESEVMFSGLLHGNPLLVILASEDRDRSGTIPITLIRMAAYDAELISLYLGDENLAKTVATMREAAFKRLYNW